jgi:peptidoglycan/xylan/chitin deacetylase (PgdA/CDA1 family)
MNAIALGYHDVLEENAAQRAARSATRLHYAMTMPEFRTHLAAIVAARASIAHAARPLSWRQVPVFLTFDDGADCAMAIADELEQHHWAGHFFITTDWIGRPGFLTAPQILGLHERGHAIGSHSCTHPARMSRLSDSELDREWRESRRILSEVVGEEVRIASVPDGYYSRRVACSAACAGIRVLFTSEPTASISDVDGCLTVGRYFLLKHSPARLSGMLAQGKRWPRWQQTLRWQLKKPIKAIGGELYLKVRRELLSRRTIEETPMSAISPKGRSCGRTT